MSTPEEAAAIRAAELRITVASEKGLPAGMARRLRGGTRAELEADADQLAPHFEPAESAKPDTMNDFIRAKAGRQPERPRQTGPHDDINTHIRAVAGR
jgi:hypothetical protein